MKEECLPDFIIVGSMKCGTTSLKRYLSQSESIYMSSVESHFFSRSYNYNGGPERYIELLKSDGENKKLIGDDSPSYSFNLLAAERIHKLLPNVKIIWCLRDPLNRSVSNYWHSVRQGGEQRDINEAFTDELNGKTRNRLNRYLLRSSYVQQIKRYLKFFEKDNIIFISLDEMISSTGTGLKKICNFLEVKTVEAEFPQANSTSYYPKPEVNRYLKSSNLTLRNARAVRALTSYERSEIPTLKPSVREECLKYLAYENQELSKLTGIEEFTV